MRGRKPKPLAIHKAQGTFRPDRHSGAVSLPPGTPARPDHLTGDGAAEWDRLVSHLAPGVLSTVDQTILAAFCQCHARLVEAEHNVEQLGAVIETKNGPRVSPWRRIADEQRKQLRGLASELGLSPASRSRVTPTVTEQPANNRARFFGGA